MDNTPDEENLVAEKTARCLDVVRMLRDGAMQLKGLRQRNHVLESQMEVVRIFGAVALGERGTQVSSPDVAWEMERQADAIEQELGEKEGK